MHKKNLFIGVILALIAAIAQIVNISDYLRFNNGVTVFFSLLSMYFFIKSATVDMIAKLLENIEE